MNGGHVFHHLQKVGRFDEASARFYAAELLCAFEYLHDSLDVAFWFKSGNILFDSQGHITVCSFNLYTRQGESEDSDPKKWPEYPPPELLVEDEDTIRVIEQGKISYEAVNWWTLGIFLFEMLTGLPPFYGEDPETISRNILKQEIQLPTSMTPSAKDILKQLLEPRPERRLAVHGAAEIKAHAFFAEVEWQRLLQRGFTPPFQPERTAGAYKHYGVTYPWKPPPSYEESFRERFAGWIDPDSLLIISRRNITPERADATDKSNNDWKLVWLDAAQEFRFVNRVTNEEARVPIRKSYNPETASVHDLSSPHIPSLPTETQKLDALEAAMNNEYDLAIFNLLDHGLNLNTPLSIKGLLRTPLQYAVMRNKSDLVLAFLSRNTQPLDRAATTQALALAVEQQNVPITTILLTNGAACNFRDSDPPGDKKPHFQGEGQFSDDWLDFTPPLVRAVQYGNVEIARLLAAHGADVNAEYHDLSPDRDQTIHFTCGRVVQLAMELGPPEMARFLVESRADVHAAQKTVYRYEKCGFVERAVYQRVVAGLRALERGARSRSGSPGNVMLDRG
ncbi:serine threonine-protein kinase gad8 [Paraphaeosphaeria minitans]|uniref:Serine threonine-protein kinase gad8 n=1 Tax=Paraphaeosphaeria minitans TaxID=565426 RepID=A0A9P6G664_9PLEO|nr:serine threonine-protein kinase gad8 [Paraphaeosphaeria minitans]